MINRLTVLIISFCIPALHNILYAQPEVDAEVTARLNDYCRSVPYEDIYAHTDRDFYTAGEDVWFRIFATDRQTGKLSVNSTIAYCELINPNNSPVVRKRFLLGSGHGNGFILLPDTLTSGAYTLRIYTNLMKNFLPGNFFMKEIYIYNAFKGNNFKRKATFEKRGEKDLNIEFFPEGGTLINEVLTKVAVKVTDRYQQGIRFYGTVRNNLGDSVNFFRTDGSGIASFEFKPHRNQKYNVEAAGLLTYLPDISGEGCSVKVDNAVKDRLTIDISLREETPGKINRMLFLFIHTRGIRNYSEIFRLSGDEMRITIPGSVLIPGVNHITLFTAEGKPLCERYIFTRDDDHPDPIFPERSNYDRREKVALELDMSGIFTGNIAGADPGVSVSLQTPDFISQDIDDYYVFGTEFGLLPSGFAGEKIRDIEDSTIDNFLLTAQSRWLSWDEILSKNTPSLKYLPESDGQYLTGLVRKRDSEEIVPGKLLYLSIPGKIATFQYAVTDGSGQFRFLLPSVAERKDLIIQPAVPDEENTIQIELPYSDILYKYAALPDTTFKEIPGFAKNFSTSYQVNKVYNIVNRTEATETAIQQQAGYRFYGKPEIEVFLKDFIRLPAMQEIFFELTPGIRLRSNRSGYDVRINNPADNTLYDDSPLVMIDGVVVNELSVLANLDPEIVEKIEAVRTPYLTGGLIHYGVLNVITLKGNFQNITLPDYVARVPYTATDPLPSFTSRDYPDDTARKSRIPDFRNTLLWNPDIKHDDQGKIKFEFTTCDRPGNYVINIQGITGDGKFISGRKIITVK